MFWGLSFWLPMLPGMWLSRQLFGAAAAQVETVLADYWTLRADVILERFGSSAGGLTSQQAAERLLFADCLGGSG